MILHRMSRKDVANHRKRWPDYKPNKLVGVNRYAAVQLYSLMRKHEITPMEARVNMWILLFQTNPSLLETSERIPHRTRRDPSGG